VVTDFYPLPDALSRTLAPFLQKYDGFKLDPMPKTP
jgi:hypothetical protein